MVCTQIRPLFCLVAVTLVWLSFAEGGITGVYWPNSAMGGIPALRRVDSEVRVGTTPFVDYFSVRWTGKLSPPTSGEYLFTSLCDGGLNLWVDGHLLIDAWSLRDGNITQTAVVNITLEAFQTYEIDVMYLHGFGKAAVTLFWYDVKRLLAFSSPCELTGPPPFFFFFMSFSLSSVLCREEVHGKVQRTEVPSSAFVDSSISAESQRFQRLNAKWAQGWNTWKVNDMLQHVLLPNAFSLHVGMTLNSNGTTFSPPAIVRCPGNGPVQLTPGLHSANGTFTEVLDVTWQNTSLRVRSGHAYDGNDMVLEVAVLRHGVVGVQVVLDVGWVLGQEGLGDIRIIQQQGGDVVIEATNKGRGLAPIHLYPTPPPSDILGNNKLIFEASTGMIVGVSSGRKRTLADIQAILYERRTEEEIKIASYNEWADTYKALSSVIAWNTIYDPRQGVFTTISRSWSFGDGTQTLSLLPAR